MPLCLTERDHGLEKPQARRGMPELMEARSMHLRCAGFRAGGARSVQLEVAPQFAVATS